MADQEALPFKMLYGLQEGGCRIFVQPDTCHQAWNDCRNSIRRAHKQYCILLSLTISNMAHGPYGSARNHQTMQQAAESLSQCISQDGFDNLVESMCRDMLREPDDPRVPQCPEDIPRLHVVNHLPIYVISLEYYCYSIFGESNILTLVGSDDVSSQSKMVNQCSSASQRLLIMKRS